ncbi:MAG: LPS export ABC transporter periplasmic protein LptC [Candidatus Eremiobacter antarcticus]|nr:LPS export ABC transporter periplasmic protein LptC [Candidatus Eremiobacteraeota bacterium]MBC5808158.1 LPS export ABC transporter periplasmic protein LptC [Candidatus Eremiobacteraeota bacterium]PZR63553.1 MAG: LPS export ABC transporter periplasmic protein LptC [Candidatus Eremiobacter sp. RRmetagenome_bin22]
MRTIARLCMVIVSAAATACTHGHPQQAPSSPRGAPHASAAPRALGYRISARGARGRPVTISNIVHGKPDYQLLAASVVYATDVHQGTFKDNTLFFYKEGAARLTVRAPAALVDQTSHNIALSGGVLAKTAGGDTLRSDTMMYNDKTQLLTAIGHVVAGSAGGYRLTGKRAVADLDLQQIRLFGDTPAPAPTGLQR